MLAYLCLKACTMEYQCRPKTALLIAAIIEMCIKDIEHASSDLIPQYHGGAHSVGSCIGIFGGLEWCSAVRKRLNDDDGSKCDVDCLPEPERVLRQGLEFRSSQFAR